MTYHLTETRNKELIAKFCQRDPVLFAYFLGDLDEFFFDRTRWWYAHTSNDTSPQALTLWYQSPSLLVIQGLSEGDAQERVWRKLLPLTTDELHVHYQAEHEEALSQFYRVNPFGTFYKMKLQKPLNEDQLSKLAARAETATSADLPIITDLQNRAYPSSYFDQRLLETGECSIVKHNQTAISFAACHVCSDNYGVASLGAITTDPNFRRQGFASAVTAEILQNLQGRISDICLNVHSANPGAIAVYEKLGFEIYCEYQEAILTRKG